VTRDTEHLTASAVAFPHGRTARRLDWRLLPPMLRRMIEERLGAKVTAAESAGAGFTPGFASTLTGANGRTIFVKAASKKAQQVFADSYREEIRKLRHLPQGLPVPQLLWSHEDDLWVVLALEHVTGANPSRPWQPDHLAACLDTLEVLADALTPPPMRLTTFADDLTPEVACWDYVRQVEPDRPHLDDAAELAARVGDVTAGNTLVHTDVRDDNFLVDGTRAVLCDWNWPVVGAPWIDTVMLLCSVAGDGIDADALLDERRLTRNVDPEHVDALLAVLAGYFLKHRDDPVPNSSPYIRQHQAWYADATWNWLAQRRGWQ
jgi:aminoglycoside phosphotransferase (APT) family kinase protein